MAKDSGKMAKDRPKNVNTSWRLRLFVISAWRPRSSGPLCVPPLYGTPYMHYRFVVHAANLSHGT